jgi:hypothetical protein
MGEVTSRDDRGTKTQDGPGGAVTEITSPAGADPSGMTIHRWSTCGR